MAEKKDGSTRADAKGYRPRDRVRKSGKWDDFAVMTSDELAMELGCGESNINNLTRKAFEKIRLKFAARGITPELFADEPEPCNPWPRHKDMWANSW